MKRRKVAAPSTVPAQLSRYVAEEWAEDPQAWYDARAAYIERGGELPHLSGSDWPDVPFDPDAL